MAKDDFAQIFPCFGNIRDLCDDPLPGNKYVLHCVSALMDGFKTAWYQEGGALGRRLAGN